MIIFEFVILLTTGNIHVAAKWLNKKYKSRGYKEVSGKHKLCINEKISFYIIFLIDFNFL